MSETIAEKALDEIERLLKSAQTNTGLISRYDDAMNDMGIALSILPTLRAALTPPADGEALHFRFSKNDHGPLLTFVETENAEGYSVSVGEWSDDGQYRILTIPNPYKLRATLLPLAERCAAAEARVKDLETETTFLLARLRDFDNGDTMTDDGERDFHGHVLPSISRLAQLLKDTP